MAGKRKKAVVEESSNSPSDAELEESIRDGTVEISYLEDEREKNPSGAGKGKTTSPTTIVNPLENLAPPANLGGLAPEATLLCTSP